MGKYSHHVLVGLFGLLLPETALANAVSLPDAVRSGLQRSPELGQAQARVRGASAAEDAARREWRPKVALDAVAGVRRLENDARINAGLSSLEEYPRHGSITLEQPLVDFGRRDADIKSRAASSLAARTEQAAAVEQVSLEISRAFLQARMQERIASAARENVAAHQRLADDVRAAVARGALSIAEQQQATERLQNAQVQLTDAENDLAIARETLAQLTGQPVDMLGPVAEAGAALPPTLADAEARVASADPAVIATLARYDAARYGTTRAARDRLPLVALQGAYRYGKDFEGYRGLTKDAQGLVTFRWTLFDGGVQAARTREAAAAQDEAGFALAAALRDSQLRARVAWQQVQALRQRLAQEEQRQLAAAQVIESYQAQFDIGRRSLLDLLDARAALHSANVLVETTRARQLLAEYALLAQSRELAGLFGIDPAAVETVTYDAPASGPGEGSPPAD